MMVGLAATRLVVALWLAAMLCEVEAGWPQCLTSISECPYERVSADFGYVTKYKGNKGGTERNVLPVPLSAKEMCNRTNWETAESCLTSCPLRLTLTAPPRHSGTRLCVKASEFMPYAPNSSLDLHHPLNGKELELVAVGTTNDAKRNGCRDKDYDKDEAAYRGKLVVVTRGLCSFSSKFQRARKFGGVAGLLVNVQGHDGILSGLNTMGGTSQGLEDFVSVSLGRQGGYPLLEMLDQGEVVKGRLELSCTPDVPPQDYAGEGCPATMYQSLCETKELPSQRLCGKCPLEVQVNASWAVCLWGNELLPRRNYNVIWRHPDWSLPATLEGVYVSHLPRDGCLVEDFVPFKGEVLFAHRPQTCLLAESARNAEKAGVRAIVYVENRLLEAYSTFVRIPVHTLSAEDSVAFTQYMRQVAGGDVHRFAITLREGGERSRVPPPPGPPGLFIAEQVEAERDQFEWTAVVVVFVLLMTVLALMVVGKLWHGIRRTGQQVLRYRKASVPLSVATMLLSVTFFVTLVSTAFSLAHQAGQQSTETAQRDAERAVGATYENAVSNVNDLSRKWREAAVTAAHREVWWLISMAVRGVSQITRHLRDFDLTWAKFKPLQRVVLNIGRSLPGTHKIRTTNGFYVDDYKGSQMTDDRPDSERNDGQPHVSLTNNGLLYGNVLNKLRAQRDEFYFAHAFPRSYWDPSKTVGMNFGNTFELTQHLQHGELYWYSSRYNFPMATEDLATELRISVLTPVYNLSNDVVATVEGTIELKKFKSMGDAVRSLEGGESTETFAIDLRTGELLYTSSGMYEQYLEWLGRGGVLMPSVGMVTWDTTDSVVMNCLGAVLRGLAPDSGDEIGGAFDQRELYSERGPGWVRMAVDFQGGPQDVSGNAFAMEAQGGGCSGGAAGCVVDGRSAGHKALRFDGETVLFVYQNLTIDDPSVRATRVSAPGEAWRSSAHQYNTTTTLSDGTEVVASYYSGEYTTAFKPAWLVSQVSIAMWIYPEAPISDSPVADNNSPRLFTNARLGDATVRWYANGMLHLGVSKFLCRTNPIPGGPPVNAWTHLVMVLDYAYKFECRVYVNGTLHDAQPIREGKTIDYSYPEPYTFGEYFVGRMEGLKVFNISFTEGEARTLYETGGFKRDVPSRRWAYNLKRLEWEGKPPLQLMIGVVVPEEDILRQVNENNAIMRQNLATQEANTRKTLDQTVTEAVFVLVAVTLLAVLVFLVFNDMLTKPFARFAVLMTDAAHMVIDDTPDNESMITELHAMHRAMFLLMSNLKEYRSYMPQSLLAMNDGSSSDGDHSTAAPSVGRGTASSREIGSITHTTSHSSGSSTPNIAARMKAAVIVALSRKRASFCYINLLNFHDELKEKSLDRLLEKHSNFVTSVMGIAGNLKGVADTFCGDRMLLSFNAVRPTASHKQLAVKCLLQLQGAFSADLQTTISASSGEVTTGNMGTEGMKRFSFISPVVTWVFVLERVAKHLGVRNLVDLSLSKDQSVFFYMRTIDLVVYAKRSDTPVQVSEVVREKEAEEDEWMYQMDKAATSDPCAKWNDMVEAVFMGNWKLAEDLSQDVSHPSRCQTEAKRAAIAAQNYDPIPIHFH